MSVYDEFLEYVKEHEAIESERTLEATSAKDAFLRDFPQDRILGLSMEEFLYSGKNHGNPNSFCNRIISIPFTASMGNAWPSTYGLYLKGGVEIVINPTYKKVSGGDVDTAFRMLKQDVYDLITAGGEKDYEAIEKCRLNSAFKFKILNIYHPDNFFNVCTSIALDQYTERLGLIFPKSATKLERNLALVELGKSCEEFKGWSNREVMGFADWMWEFNKYYTPGKSQSVSVPKTINDPAIPVKVWEEDGEIKVTCPRCKYDLLKAPRCPECGQLIKY